MHNHYRTTYYDLLRHRITTLLSHLNGNIGNVMISESVLLKATKLPIGFFAYSLSGSSYLSDDLPNNSYKYGSAVILKRSPTSIVVALFGIDSAPLAFNFYNGSDWAGWRIYITNSDFSYVDCIVVTTGGSFVRISDAPNSDNYIPVVMSHFDDNSVMDHVFRDVGVWYIYSTVSQRVRVRFFKYPV